jgi:hypothetical protein
MKGRELQPALHIDMTKRPALSFRPLAGACARLPFYDFGPGMSGGADA